MGMLLAEKFPDLNFVKEADDWLLSIKEKPIEKQLAERKIAKIRVWPIFYYWGFSIIKNYGIVLVLDDRRPKEYFSTLGHEIAHTFHFDLKKNPVENNLPKEISGFANMAWEKLPAELRKLYNLVEHFCDEFSKLWINANDEGTLREFWEKNKNTDLLSEKYDI